MPGWLNPIALVGLLAAAGPIAVHLLRRQRAARLPFPSLRFVRAATTAAVRLRSPSDIGLLFLRMAIVSGAAVALAQPLFVTRARRALWDGRVSRALVVDTSASMTAASQRAAEAATAEVRGAMSVARVESDRLREGLLQAIDTLSAVPPSRREIVVISDFPLGSLDGGDIAGVPSAIGLRFVNVGAPRVVAEFRGLVGAGAPGVASRIQYIHATPDGTSVRLTPAPSAVDGLRLIDAAGAGDSLRRAVARAGAPAPSALQPLALAFNASTAAAVKPTSGPMSQWMVRTILRMRRDRSLARAAREHRRQGPLPPTEANVVARDANGAAVVTAVAGPTELLLSVAAAPADYLSVVAIRSALIARQGDPAWEEQEVAQIPASQLAAWTRDPGPADITGSSAAAPGDARWVWLLVLGLLTGEALARKGRVRREAAAYAHVA